MKMLKYCKMTRFFFHFNLDSQSPQTGDWLHGPEADRIKKNQIQPKTVVPLNKTEVYATVLFTEFLKELAATAQEHSILSHFPTDQ